MMMEALELRRLMANWIAEDYGANRIFDIAPERVNATTVRSAKRLDYACVFLMVMGLDLLGDSTAETTEELV